MDIYILILHNNFKANGTLFDVTVEPSSSVKELKIMVLERAKNLIGHLDIIQLEVWKTIGEKILNSSDPNWKQILQDIKFDDPDTIREVFERDKVEDFGLRDDEILLVRMGSTSRISTAPEPLSDNCVHKDAARGTTTSDGGSEAEDEVSDLDMAFLIHHT